MPPLRRSIITALLVAGCTAGDGSREETLVLASTTSTEDSGLFDVLIPAFEAAHPGIRVHVVAVGTGQALELGRRGDADVLLVHSPAAESAFVAAGHGTERREVMYNDFVIVGPASDPAGVRGLTDAVEALGRIARVGARFVSRGDDSGTHKKERELWTTLGIEPEGAWYLDAGQGMGEVLGMASEMRAYTLTDRSTFLFMKDRLELEIVVEGDPRIYNHYGVIPVRGAKRSDAAHAFAHWITAREGQAVISDYGVERFGRPLFIPSAPRATP